MSIESIILIAILAYTVVAFVREWMPLDQVALSSLALLLLFNLVTVEEAVSGFSNQAVVTIMMMFVLSDGLVRSGVVAKLAHRIARHSGDSYWRAAISLMAVTGVLSAFINNVAAVTIFMPVAIHLSHHYKRSPSQLLLPLSYASIFGGTCTLIGTSTNLLVSSLAEEHGAPPFTMFELSALGLVLFGVGMLYNCMVPMRQLPERGGHSADLTRKYAMAAYLTELKVPEGSPLVGRTVLEERISERFQLTVLEVIRGRRKIAQDLRNTEIEAGDLLLVRGAMESILSFKEQRTLHLLTDIKLSDEDLSDAGNILAEVQLSPTSPLAGLTLKDINFRARFGGFVLAINRTGEPIRDKIAFIPLKAWDTLLVFGPRTRIEALDSEEDFVPLKELELHLRLPRRWWLSTVIVPLVILLAATGLMSILKASILGVVAMLVTRVLTIQQAYKAINWTVIFLVAAILPLGKAMINTGLAQSMAEGIAEIGAASGPYVVIALLYLSTAMMTEFMSNNSTAVLMVPIALGTAEVMGLNPRTLLMAVAFAASSSFLTPMGYQTNTMVHGPGGYRFADYLRAGIPLKIAFWILTTLLIPVLWPF